MEATPTYREIHVKVVIAIKVVGVHTTDEQDVALSVSVPLGPLRSSGCCVAETLPRVSRLETSGACNEIVEKDQHVNRTELVRCHDPTGVYLLMYCLVG